MTAAALLGMTVADVHESAARGLDSVRRRPEFSPFEPYLAKYILDALESVGSFDADDEAGTISTAAAIYDGYAAI